MMRCSRALRSSPLHAASITATSARRSTSAIRPRSPAAARHIPRHTLDVNPRYRTEGDVHCVDVRLNTVEQLFDNRDPAPFRERDLDPDLVEYLFAAGEDLVSHGKFKIVFW